MARQRPSLVARLLNLGLRENGISQVELQRELGIAQPRLSKLIRKLRDAGWIKVKKSGEDTRVKLMTTIGPARDRLVSLKTELAALRAKGAVRATAPVPQSKPVPFRRGKRIQEQLGQTKFKLVVFCLSGCFSKPQGVV